MKALIAELGEEIARLQEARSLLAGTGGKPRRDRPAAKPTKRAGARRNLSPEARAKIAAAQKKRWAKARKDKKAKPATSK